MRIPAFAAAKVNLTLEILGRRSDGYHALRSLVAFALDAGDRLTLEPSTQLELETTGPEATAIEGGNLVLTVAEAIQRAEPATRLGIFRLEKHLPVAAGLGGGSADAAAAIRAIARLNGISDPEAAYGALVAGIGADIPVCIGGDGRRAAFMTGIGELVWRPQTGSLLPRGGLAAVLVNPRVAVPTGQVFAALGAPAMSPESNDVAKPPAPFANSSACFAYLKASRNDLEAPAIAIAPAIADVLARLQALSGCRLARMSGSGATCFGLFEGVGAARLAADELREAEPGWWVAASRLE